MPREQDLVFVSYRHADTAAWVGMVYSILSESLDVNVFRDTKGIAFGEPIPKAVRANLDKAKLLVLVVGPRWYDPPQGEVLPSIHFEQDWVRFEIKTALARDIPIVPLYFDGAKFLLKKHLPEDVSRIGQLDVNETSGAPRGLEVNSVHAERDLRDLAQQLATQYGFPLKSVTKISVPAAIWQPTADWQLKLLAQIDEERGTLKPAIAPQSNKQEWPLSSVFVPLELENQRGLRSEGTIDWNALIREERIVLTGEPGAGKSTLLQHLVLSASEQRRVRLKENPEGVSADGTVPDALSRLPLWLDLPVVVQAMRKKRAASGEGEAAGRKNARRESLRNIGAEDWLGPLGDAARLRNPDQSRALLETGEILLVLDGLDEVADSDERIELLKSIAKLPSWYGGVGVTNRVVIACRDKAWDVGGPFVPFERVHIRPMTRPKWEQYIERWCRAVWEDSAEEILAELKKSLRSSRAVQEMAANPQTATMLTVLAQQGEIPEQRVRLYDAFVRRALDNDRMEEYGAETDVRGHLIALAVALQNGSASGQPVDVNQARLILGERLKEKNAESLSKPALRQLGTPLLDDLELHTGLISVKQITGKAQGRPEVYFRHRTVQEFLVACSFADEPNEILEHATEPSWLVPIALTCGLLAKDFDEETLEDFLHVLIKRPGDETEISPAALLEWGKRVAVLSACLEEVSSWELEERTLAPAREAHAHAGRRLMEFELRSRVAIAEGMGFIGDPRLTAQDRWVQIPAGSSLLGSESQEAWPQERPVREVKLSEYWVQRWPVTVSEFASFVDDARGYEDDQWWDEAGLQWRNNNDIAAPDEWERLRVFGNRPTTGVCWWEARAYARWLNSVQQLPENWSVTLPTEAQWERAARGPYDSAVHHAGRFPWGTAWDDEVERANCNRLPFAVCPVGLFLHGHSPEGVWDLAGNISELCLDGFGPPSAAEGADPCQTDYRYGHSLRGGDWASPILNARVSARFPDLMSKRSDHRVGFRCVAWLAPEALR